MTGFVPDPESLRRYAALTPQERSVVTRIAISANPDTLAKVNLYLVSCGLGPFPAMSADEIEDARKRLARRIAQVDDETAERVGG